MAQFADASIREAGWVAQLVEQRTENPCVGGSIPSLATVNDPFTSDFSEWVFCFYNNIMLFPCPMKFHLASRNIPKISPI